jgi:hypothetical protein
MSKLLQKHSAGGGGNQIVTKKQCGTRGQVHILPAFVVPRASEMPRATGKQRDGYDAAEADDDAALLHEALDDKYAPRHHGLRDIAEEMEIPNEFFIECVH